MATSNYQLCDNCNAKTIYIGEDPSTRFLIFCNDECCLSYAARTVAQKPTAEAKARRGMELAAEVQRARLSLVFAEAAGEGFAVCALLRQQVREFERQFAALYGTGS